MTYGQSAAQRYECHDREPNISHPARPNSVNKHFIIWLIRVENLENLFLLKKDAINWRVRDNHKNDSTIKTFPLFFRVRTGNSYFIEKRDIFFPFLFKTVTNFFGTTVNSVFIFNFIFFCDKTAQVHYGQTAFSGPGVRFSRAPETFLQDEGFKRLASRRMPGHH